MADAGTPTFLSSSETAAAISASWPVTPSTERNFIRWSSAAFTSTDDVAVLMLVLPFLCYLCCSSLARDYNPQGRPRSYQAAKSNVQITKIQAT